MPPKPESHAGRPQSPSARVESHSARFFALLYSPAPQQQVLETLFDIEREVSDSLRPGLDHHVAHSRLQWWSEECERTARGQPVHPLSRALIAALGGRRPVGLSGFVDTAVWDLAGATFETRRELAAYCERWAAAMIEPLLPLATSAPQDAARAPSDSAAASRSSVAPATRDSVLASGATHTAVGHDPASVSSPDKASAANWRALGAAIRELELLTDLALEAHYGRLRVPLLELENAKTNPGALAKPPWPDAVAQLLRARHRALRDEIASVVARVDRQQRYGLRGILVWAALVWRSSQRAERALPDRLRPGRFDAIVDAWFAWRIARRTTTDRFTLN